MAVLMRLVCFSCRLGLAGLIVALAFTCTGWAGEPLLRLDELAIEASQSLPGSYTPYLQDSDKGYAIDLNMGAGPVFWNNVVETATDQSQFRMIGWDYSFGGHLGSYVDVYFHHHSQHLLDATWPFPYPREQEIGVKLYLYKGDRR